MASLIILLSIISILVKLHWLECVQSKKEQRADEDLMCLTSIAKMLKENWEFVMCSVGLLYQALQESGFKILHI